MCFAADLHGLSTIVESDQFLDVDLAVLPFADHDIVALIEGKEIADLLGNVDAPSRSDFHGGYHGHAPDSRYAYLSSWVIYFHRSIPHDYANANRKRRDMAGETVMRTISKQR